MAVFTPGKILVESYTLINNYGTSSETRTNISKLALSTSIYENIFSPYMYGFVKVRDSYNLYSSLPITDKTYVFIRLRDPNTAKVVELLFKVFKVSNVEQDSTKMQTYDINFTSVELFNARRIRISEHITGNIPTAIERIHKQISNKPISVDTDAAKANLYLPLMNADRSIQFLLGNIKYKGGVPDYCYWETFRGFNCKSLSNCLLTSPVQEFSTNTDFVHEGDYTYSDFIKINDILAEHTFDSAKMLNQGWSGATTFSYDPLTGSSYFEATGEEPLSNIYAFSDRSIDYVSLSKRQQLLNKLPNTYYYISVPGLIGRSSGDLADVTVYNGNNMNTPDRTFSGRRLICGIAHIISIDEYTQNITLGDYYVGG